MDFALKREGGREERGGREGERGKEEGEGGGRGRKREGGKEREGRECNEHKSMYNVNSLALQLHHNPTADLSEVYMCNHTSSSSNTIR